MTKTTKIKNLLAKIEAKKEYLNALETVTEFQNYFFSHLVTLEILLNESLKWVEVKPSRVNSYRSELARLNID